MAPAAHLSGSLPMIALQRSAGNASAVALLRRARGVADEPPVMLTLSGVVDHAAVISWSLADARGKPAWLDITRRIDSDSPRLAQALRSGAAGVTATLLVRKLTPLGWIRDVSVTMEDCMVSSYQVHDDDHESIGLTFTRMQVER